LRAHLLRENLIGVRGRIADAARAAGRSPAEVRLVAVTKYVDTATSAILVELGQTDLGESRPQQLWDKAAALGELAAASRETLDVLLEVNVSGEAAKHGFAIDEFGRTADDLQRTAEALAALSHLNIRGLMCMAGLDDDPAAARRDFARLREVRDRLRQSWSERFTLSELSMGMSGDFEAAVAEGATIVRVGSALFEGLDSETGETAP
jgi:uncharacterized pyridoxal phosphate-containing UPF0001 family protein